MSQFLQSLANPYFVHEIAMKGTLSTPEMLKCALRHWHRLERLTIGPVCSYLTYLTYFHSPLYSRFVRYPLSLSMLDLLRSSPTFRNEIAKPEVAHLFGRKILAGWMHAGGAGGRAAGAAAGGDKPGGKGVVELVLGEAAQGTTAGAPGLAARMNGAIGEDMDVD